MATDEKNSTQSLVVADASTLEKSDAAYSRVMKIVAEIKTYEVNVRVYQFKIAINLLQINDEKLYEAVDCKNIVEFGEKYFGYKKANTYLLLSVARHFLDASDEDKIRSIFANNNGDFSFSQLAELSHITTDANKIRELITEKNIQFDTPVKELRALRKNLKVENANAQSPKVTTPPPKSIDSETVSNDEGENLKAENENLKAENEKLKAEYEKLKAENEKLKKLVDVFKEQNKKKKE